jgi:hypothetical protein
MAAVQKMIDSITGKTEEEAKTKERLNFLINTVESKLKLAEIDLAKSLMGQKEGIDKLFILPETITKFKKGYTVGLKSEVNAGIKGAVDSFFSGGDDVKKGFQQIIQSSLDILLGSTSVGQHEETIYTVAMEHNVFVRVDAYVWKYYFESKGLSDKVEQAVCYTFCKSVIDHKKVPVDTMIYLISEAVGDNAEKLDAYFTKMKELYKKLNAPANNLENAVERVGPLLERELEDARAY